MPMLSVLDWTSSFNLTQSTSDASMLGSYTSKSMVLLLQEGIQLNTNCLIFDSPCFIVNKFEHVLGWTKALYRGGWAWCPVQRGSWARAHYRDPLHCGQSDWLTDRHDWKHYFALTSLAGGNTCFGAMQMTFLDDRFYIHNLFLGCHNNHTAWNYIIGRNILYYCPQRSCGKVMFSQVSVILSTGEGVCGRHPPGRHPSRQTPPGQTPLSRHLLSRQCLSRHPLSTPSPGQTPSWHPFGQTPPTQCMMGYTPPAQCMLGYIPPTGGHCSGWYASYWNAFLRSDAILLAIILSSFLFKTMNVYKSSWIWL